MYVPVQTGAPGILTSLCQLGMEVLLSFLLLDSQDKGIPDIVKIINGTQLWDTSLQHHGQQVDEQSGSSSQDEVGILT